MSENEKRLRDWCQNAPNMVQALDALLAEHRAVIEEAASIVEVSTGLLPTAPRKWLARRIRALIPGQTAGAAEMVAAARAAALTEAADQLDEDAVGWEQTQPSDKRGPSITRGCATTIRALASSPAPAAIPVRGEDELFAAIDAEVREYRGSTAPVRDAIRRALGNAASEAILAAAAEHLARNRGLDVGGTATFLQGRVDGTVPATIPVAKVRAVLDKASATLERQGYGAGIVRDIARELGLTREEEMKPVGCCDLYGTPHQECRTAPEREPPIGPPRVRCGGCDGVLDDGACLECCR